MLTTTITIDKIMLVFIQPNIVLCTVFGWKKGGEIELSMNELGVEISSEDANLFLPSLLLL